MAKTKNTDIVFYESDTMIEQAKEVLISSTILNEEKLKQNLEIYDGLIVNGINDIPTHKAVKEGIKVLKKLRTSIEAKRKELTEPAIKYQKSLITEAERLTSIIVPIEQYLIKEDQRIEDALKIENQEQFTKRSTELTELGYQLTNGFFICGPIQVHSEQLVKLSDDEFNFYITEGKKEVERKLNADKESERIKNELAEKQAELDRKNKELDDKLAEIKRKEDELAAQQNALDKTYNKPVESELPLEQVSTEIDKDSITNDERASDFFQTRAKALLGVNFSAQPQVFQFTAPDKKIISYRQLHDMNEFDYTKLLNEYHVLKVQKEKSKTQTTPEVKTTPESIIPEQKTELTENKFQEGFDFFRTKLIELASDTEKPLSRNSLIEWANTVQP